MVTNIDNINNATGKTSASDKAAATLSGNLEDFLRLLTTQLKNQDPSNAMDTNQFTAQIAQLSTVEQQINTNRNLEKLAALFSTSQVNGVVGYIGKRVESEGNKSLVAGGNGLFLYDLPSEATSVDVSIADGTGNVVFAGQGDTKAGRNEVFWDGKNSFTGDQMADGVYSITLKAKDYAGKDLTPTTYTTGRVTAVDIKDGQPTLMLGTFAVPLADVSSIREDILASN